MTGPTPARAVAFDVVRATFADGAYTDVALREAADAAGLAGRDRAQAQRLSYGAVQRCGTADEAIGHLSERSPRQLDPPVVAALRLGLYELLFADATPDHAAVDQAVELAKRGGAAHAAGLVNAVLRRAVREREELRAGLADDSDPARAAVAHSVPPWLAELWWEELGAAGARSLLRACNQPAERALRANALRLDRDAALAELGAAGVRARPAPGPRPLSVPESLVVEGPMAGALPGIEAGRLVPQSRASAAVVALLDPRPGERVLDLCAGPGTKAGQIAARMEDRGELVAVELDRQRAAETRAAMERLGASCVRVVEGDAAEIDAGDLGGAFDRVLADVPCSDLGTLASRPDARWRKSPRLIERLASLQLAILARGARALRPGGVLVYSTCTISRRENEDVLARLLELAGGDEVPPLLPARLGNDFPSLASRHDPRALQLRPDRDRTTGFFVSRLTRHD